MAAVGFFDDHFVSSSRVARRQMAMTPFFEFVLVLVVPGALVIVLALPWASRR
jgi:hypothetical protein